jgi:predicted transcriptional regulator
MDKHSIIKLKMEGESNRSVAKLLNINRKTVSRYWNEYLNHQKELQNPNSDIAEVQEKIVSAPKYDSSNRKARKYTKEIDIALAEILFGERKKDTILGTHKQSLTGQQIHKMLVDQGFDISYCTIINKIREKNKKAKECFIKQSYNYGERLEYDFGEVKLLINGSLGTYHMAVISSPAGDFRWAYLYRNQKKEAFLDSHVKFFEMVGGVYKEVTYDNMKNVVTKFIGKNQKELNEDLLKLSIYYGFNINVTNCFSGNEKGHVEGSVKIIRSYVFANKYEFPSLEHAQIYLHSQLLKLNENSKMDEEKLHLLPYKPKLELANISLNKVNKYSFVQVENNFYSVPEYLVGMQVSVKSYFDRIMIYSNNNKVCEHKKIDGSNETSIDITHYLNSFLRKPGALKNSVALKSIPQLKTIYDEYFNTNPKKFIEILVDNNEKNIDELIDIFKRYTKTKSLPTDSVGVGTNLNNAARHQLSQYAMLSYRKTNY